MKDQSIISQGEPTVSAGRKLSVKKHGGLSRIPELDGLRGVAILLVVLFHYISTQLPGSTHPMGRMLRYATSFGWVGVDLFFVLSGFLIGSILIVQKHSPRYFSTFYMRRLVRIVPNYFLLLALFVIVWQLPYFANNYFLTAHNDIPLWSYFAMLHNFYMAARHSLGNDALSITWSIGIEEQFYLLFPLLVYFLHRRWLPYLLSALIVGAIIVRAQFDHWIPKYVLLPARMDGLAIGFLVAFLHQEGLLAKYKTALNRWLMAVMIVVIAACGYFYWRLGDLGVVKHTLFSIVFAIMLIFALTRQGSWYAAFLRNKALMWVGTISYSLYLFHYLILGVAHHITGQHDIGISNIADIGVTVAAFIASLLFSWIVYRQLEKPMVAVGKKFQY